MIIFRPEGERFNQIRWELAFQKLIHKNEKYFDQLIFEITAFHDSDYKILKEEYEGPNGYRNSGFDIEVHNNKREERIFRITREFWFDISDYF